MINRRSFLVAAGAGLFTLNESILGADTLAAATTPFILDSSPLNRDSVTAWPALADRLEAQDWATGNVMWDGGYSDQPYMVAMPDGTIISVLTVSDGDEGAATQHVIVLRSVDDGASWTTVAEIEPASAPEAVYAVPWLAPSGRLFVAYTYNTNNVRTIPNNDGTPGTTRVYCVGVFAYKSSVDGGLTWSPRREIILPVAAVDRRNPWAGAHQIFFMTGHAVTRGDTTHIGLTKIGAVKDGIPGTDTEAFIAKIREVTDGVLEVSMSGAMTATAPQTEEPSAVVFDDGVINVVHRTTRGNLGETWSTDSGATWQSDWARDTTGNIVPQPRANASQFVLPDGRLILWGHNNNSVPANNPWAGPRNPVFYRIGQRNGPRVTWGAPRLLLWDKDPTIKMSYPGIVFTDTTMLLAATDKHTAKIFRFPLPGV